MLVRSDNSFYLNPIWIKQKRCTAEKIDRVKFPFLLEVRIPPPGPDESRLMTFSVTLEIYYYHFHSSSTPPLFSRDSVVHSAKFLIDERRWPGIISN